MMRVDLTDLPDAQVGDEVVLLGRSGDAAIPLEELAEQWRMSTHDLFPAIGKTLPRRYIDGTRRRGLHRNESDRQREERCRSPSCRQSRSPPRPAHAGTSRP
ncbi:alanine racemase C-terminal domain-containing protein [Ancylobacter sp. G4_0304]|uniref:alanine racemase C-terminal domain-containing protein n=1 Tax=Ancylobacter sp. G4_0304 TaxID=3114289 RepID=UPI0039C6D53E